MLVTLAARQDFKPSVWRHYACTDPAAFSAVLLWGRQGTCKELNTVYSIPGTAQNYSDEDQHFEVPLVFPEMFLDKKLSFPPVVFRKDRSSVSCRDLSETTITEEWSLFRPSH